MSDSDDSALRPSTVLDAFCPVPERAMRDRRFGAGHHACLEALCWVIDKHTGCAIASQDRIAALTNRPRVKIADFLRDLEQWTYLRKIRRGRHAAGLRKGQYKVLIYQVIYAAAEAGALSPLGLHGSAAEAGALSPLGLQNRVTPGVTVSRVFQVQRKKRDEQSIFRAVAEADRLDRVAEDAQQMELPFAEVQRFDDLWHRAISIHGFHKIGKLSLAIRRQHRSRADYVRALTGRLEELTTEAPVDGEKHGPRKTGM